MKIGGNVEKWRDRKQTEREDVETGRERDSSLSACVCQTGLQR